MKDISFLSIAIGIGIGFALKSAMADDASTEGDTLGDVIDCCANRKLWVSFHKGSPPVYMAHASCAGGVTGWMPAGGVEPAENAMPYCNPDGSIGPPLLD